ncbi:E3 ubiquitin-protein ligase RNF4-like [Patella vulgata]|uniref:E3 ubiquitin-protein ligase RNF4-like n=1 Tax=Patella vulgata TaxID=6465 RepID=UPI0024A9892A|nr:E3 ubiquitin-protein ligase RNF4-like [Patella vulgata]
MSVNRLRTTRRRSRRRSSDPLNVENPDDRDRNTTCIDLTEDEPEIIDLTNSLRLSPSMVPVILPLSPEDEERIRSRNSRRQSRSNRRIDRSLEIISTPETRPHRNRRSRSDIDLNDHSSNLTSLEIVDVTSEPSSGSSVVESDIITSPTPVKITCPICMDDDRQIKRSGRQLTSTVCGHIFCSTCIKQSLRSFHTCPSCRKSLRVNQIHPIFL